MPMPCPRKEEMNTQAIARCWSLCSFLSAAGGICSAWLTPHSVNRNWPGRHHPTGVTGPGPGPASRTAGNLWAKVILEREGYPRSIAAASGGEVPQPPIPFRDETTFVLAGELPQDNSGGDDGTLPSPPLRQSTSSGNPLLSPPRPIPNPYGWMRDDSRTNEKVLDHLRAENEYGQRMTSHLQGLREELYQEFLSSIHETDYTTPALKTATDGGTSYWYYSRFEAGESYPRYCRAPQSDKDQIYPPQVNQGWDEKNVDSDGSAYFPPLLPGEEVYLDVPEMARNKSYFAVGAIAVSPNQQYVAFSLDEKGGETCQMYVKHIETGQVWALHEFVRGNVIAEEESNLLECDGSVVWNDESNALYFVTMDEAHRPEKLYKRKIFDKNGRWIDYADGQKEEADYLLLEEKDDLFNLRIYKTFDGKYLIARCSSKESSEVHYLDLRPNEDVTDAVPTHKKSASNELRCIARRQPKVLYRVTHCHGHWLVQTNIGGLPNLSLKSCRVGEEGMEFWKDVVNNISEVPTPVFDGGHDRSLDGVTVFEPVTKQSSSPPLAYSVVTGREEGMPRVWILELTEEAADSSTLVISGCTRLEFEEDAYDVGIGGNRDPTLNYVVISYDSLVTPPSHIAVQLSNPVDLKLRRVLKKKEVPGYNKEEYACERTHVRSRDDGRTDIPVSLVYHRDVLQEMGKRAIPTHLYGYGSYGASIESSFRGTRLPLLKRKVIYALAHVRGGGEMGRPWYEEAKYLTKKNTFNDFVDVARWLVGSDCANGEETSDGAESTIGRGITSPDYLSCEGRSAGGLLIGASINQHPELFRAAIFGVPFVDVLCTMVDATIPLTVAEWEEWGNPNEGIDRSWPNFPPNEEKYFDYMMSYCPMNNVKPGAVYPTCLITGGLHDPRVQYWEPAKFAAELRHQTSKDSGTVLLKMDMDSGHFSASDRYKYLRELAFEYAFLLDALNVQK